MLEGRSGNVKCWPECREKGIKIGRDKLTGTDDSAPGQQRAEQRSADSHAMIIRHNVEAPIRRGESHGLACSYFGHCRSFLGNGDNFSSPVVPEVRRI